MGGAKRLDVRPFDYERRLNSVLILEDGGERRIIVKGAPEAVMARSTAVAPQAKEVLQDLFAQGSRVVAVATRNANGQVKLTDASGSVLPQPREQAADLHHASLRGNRRLSSVLAARARAGVPAPAGGLLRVPRRNGHRLPGAGRARKDVLLSPHAGGAASRGQDSAQASASSRLPLERPEARVKGPTARRPPPWQRRRSGTLAGSLADIGPVAAS